MTTIRAIVLLLALTILGALVACGEEPEPTPATVAPAAAVPPDPTATKPPPSPTATVAPKTGQLEVRVTDPPPPDVEQYLVTLSSVEVNKQKTGEGSPWVTIVDEPVTFDLVELEGVEQFLGTAVADPGTYRIIRMHIQEAKLKLKGEDELKTAKVPSDKIQLVRNFTVEAGELIVLLLDFDGDKSVTLTGAGDFIFKPVLTLTVPVEGGKPTAEAEERTDTPQPTETPAPTATVGPTATPEPTATATATPEPTPDPLGEELFLEISSPVLDEDGVAVVSEPSVSVVGRTRLDAAVTVGVDFVDVDENGRFEATVVLAEGPNLIDVVVSLGTGEELSEVLIVSYEPPAESQ